MTGGDTCRQEVSPFGAHDLTLVKILLQVGENVLFVAKENGKEPKDTLSQTAPYLFSIREVPNDLKLSSRWTSQFGRMYPYQGFETYYEAAGFNDVLGNKTIRIHFSGMIDDLAKFRSEVDMAQINLNSYTQKFEGNVYLDIQTGLLVRQDVEWLQCLDGDFCAPVLPSGKYNIKFRQITQLDS